MGGSRTSAQVLLLSAVGVVCISTLVSAISNTTSGPGPVINQNSNHGALSSAFQETCHAVNLQNASRTISAAVDTLARELSCNRFRNASLPEDKSKELEQKLRQIVETTVKVFVDLATNQTGFNVLDVFGILNSLSLGNHSDSEFIRLWFSLKMAPLLSYVDENFLTQLSSQNFSCNSFHELIKGIGNELEASRRMENKQIYTHFIQVYLSRKNLPEPGCTQNVNGSAEWLKRNLGKFSVFASLQDLKEFNSNFSAEEALEQLSPKQKAELILDPDSGALEDEAIVREVFASLTESRDEDNDDEDNDEEDEDDEDGDDDEQLNQFFQVFATISKQRNVTFIRNPGVRDTILNLTLTALAPEFVDFEPEDFQLWFQVNLAPVMASIRPGSLVVIPRNISCASYASVIAGLRQSLRSLPLHLSANVRSSIEWLKETFKRCSLPDSFMCKQTPVDEKRICALTHSSQLEQPLPIGNSSEGLCNFTINEHACSSATHLTSSNLVTLLKCSVESQRTEPVELWKLLFRKVSSSLDQALMTFTTMAPNNSNPSLSPALEALGELRIANFSQAQLQSEAFVSSWFQTKIRPFLASPSPNFLFCLAIRNFSCQTYQTVIQAFSSQRPSMDNEGQQAVFTHFIKPFLSSNDSSDPGCVSFSNSSEEWLEANLGSFSGFATLQDLLALNPNFSSAESLSVLTPSQLAQLTLSLGASNDTDQIDRVFERLEEGNALENVDEFLTQLAENEKRPDFRPVVRDRVMKRTFSIISPHFPNFTDKDWFVWFHQKLVPVLPSFNAMMLKKATSNISCTNYRVVVSGMSKASSEMPLPRREEIAAVMLAYLRNATAGVIDEPACRRGNESDAEWLEANLGPFSQNTAYSDLKAFNISGVAVVDSLSAKQKAELILDPDSGALEDEAIVREVFASLTESRDDDNDDEDNDDEGNDEEDEDDEDGDDDEQLNQFFQVFATISKQRNVTFIRNPGVRDTILNLTLTALAPEFVDFEPEDFQLWFQVNLAPVMASIRPGSLVVIPRNISCASYASVIAGLRQSLRSLPLHLSANVRSSIEWLKETFKRCSLPDSFMCKQTPVDEKRICALTHSSQLEQPLPIGNSSEGLCNFTINEHACSSATHLTSSNLVTLLKCSVESQRTEPVELWKLLFRKVSSSLDQALMTFTTMAPNNSNPSLSPALEALGELRIANFSQAQLQSEAFVSSWFQTKIRPFLASPSPNFLFCLAIRNFSCQTYQTVIQAFSSQRPSMDNEGQQAVFTHFIKPFLSSNDSSDPGCVSFSNSSEEWLEANLGSFSGFATLQDLLALNPNFSSAESLSVLTPSQLAQLTLSLGASNDTDQIDRVFERLEEGNALENVDEFLTQLAENEKRPDFRPVVRDRVMKRTFSIISPHFPNFTDKDWFVWFHQKLVPVLPSFNAMMLKKATSNISCTNYRVVVSGMSKASSEMPLPRREEIAAVMLAYLRNATAGVIDEPACRRGNESDAEWLEANLGPFSQNTAYSDLKAFNISGVAVVDSLSAKQKAELILDPDSGALEDEAIVREVFASLTESRDDDNDDEDNDDEGNDEEDEDDEDGDDDEQLNQFFQVFATISKQRNVTFIRNPGVRDTILNLTLTALAPEFVDFEPEDFQLWFQVNLAPVMASIRPGSLVVIPRNISCASYASVIAGLRQSLRSLPLHLSANVRSSIEWLKETFKRCSLPDSFMCKQTPVDEKRICALTHSSQLEQPLPIGNSSEGLCNFTINEHACSSATHLTSTNLVTLLKCSVESQRTEPVEVWKLLFRKVSSSLDQALMTFTTMAPNNSNPSLSPALEALGELRIANFSQAQLQSEAFVSSWFQTKIRPFLASPSPNFLFCLAIRNFSCQTYQTVIQAFSSQRPSMDSEGQQAVFTHFIKPFLSSNDSSDPGCVSFSNSSEEWLEANLGSFSGFATLQDLLALNPNFSSAESLSVLTPSQLAQLTLSLGASNDTDQIDRVFERLEEGNALENVDEFLTQLAENEKRPDFRPIVRDRVMKRTFSIISPHFPNFTDKDWFVWFHQKLVPVLPSFNAMMLKKATSNISCTNYRVVVSGMSKASSEMPLPRRKEIAAVMLDYLRNATAGVIDEPACRRGNESDAEWLEANLGPFSQNTAYSDLKAFNISGVAVVDSLSAKQKAELILDPDSGALEDEAIVREVFASLTESRDDDNDDEDNDEEDEDDEDGDDDEQLNQFFQAFATISKQRNVTFIRNPGVRDTILNLTLTALAPEFVDFEPEDFQLWFQVNLAPVMASIRPGSLVVIPRNISCASYASVIAGLRQSLRSLPLHLSANVRSSIEWLKETFKRCSLPDSFMCKQTPVDEKRICALTHSSQLEQPLPIGNSSEGLCNFTINEHACSSATHLTSSNLVTLLKCSVESQRTEPVEVWKLLFRKVSSSLDQALMTFTTMAPNNSNPSLSPALEALGELRIANFSQAQLQSEAFVSSWFQTKIRPFLASPSPNFLFCLAIRNFSCQTYQTVIQAFSSQRPSMDNEGQQAVFTHFIKPFLSSNDSSDPGCVSFSNSSEEWLEANLGSFSGFATLQDLLALNPNFSSAESLSVLTPSQLAQLTLSLGASNDTDQIDRVFERLEEGNALENVDEFLTQLAENEKRPDFRPVVRDRVMKRTFSIISPHFPNFTDKDWFVWFHQKLVPVLPSFNAMMLKKATSNISCTNYRVVVSGMSKASSEMPLPRREEIAAVMLAYLRNATAGVIDEPACRRGNESDAEWLEANLGPFSQNTAYSDLKAFNISGVAVVDSLSAKQKAELILDPDSGALEDEAIVREVFASLTESRDDDNDDEDNDDEGNDEEDEDDEDGDDDEQLNQFFQVFATISKQRNVTFIRNPGVRDTILNLTLTALAPEFVDFEPEDFQLWFQVNLAPVMASIRPGSLVVIPRNISCASYASVIAGLRQSLRSLPLHLSANVRSSIEWLKETFKRCSLPDSFMCKQTPVDEKRICALTHSSQLEQPLPIGNSSEGLCNFTINEHACSSATHLTSSNLVTLLKCSVESQRTEPVEVWKLLFRKVSSSLDQALMTFTTMAPNNSNPSLSPALEALGELRIANFSQAQLQSEAFVSSWFQTKIRPFLASPSPNFLFCLAIRNFSCQTYQTVIQAFSSQRPSMDSEGQQAVFTHFIKPFLSSNDSSDPGCVSFSNSSEEWLEANLGSFSGFATLQDLLALNPNFSSAESLSVLTPSQLAQLTLSLGASNDTDQIDRVFERLEEGNALENVDEFLTQLAENEKRPDFRPIVRDRVMKRTFSIISPHFPNFTDKDWFVWFHQKLVPVLPSFNAMMLKKATSNISCTNYRVVVSGMSKASSEMPLPRREEIAAVMLDYLRNATAGVIDEPACRRGNESDAEWLEANLGPFSQNTAYSDLKAFNISGVAVVDSLSAKQKAELILDPDSGALEDEAIVREVFASLTESRDDDNDDEDNDEEDEDDEDGDDDEQLNQFFQAFATISKQRNVTFIRNPGVRDTILNLTLTALAPEFVDFEPEDFQLWFQVNLAPVMASIRPGSLVVIPRNISCASYASVIAGLRQSLRSLPLHLSANVRSSIEWLKETFKRCSLPDSFMCKQTPVDEKRICALTHSSQLEQPLPIGNSSEGLCNFTINEHACSSATHLTSSNLVTLLKCSVESQRTEPVEVWKLLFRKVSSSLDQALMTFTTMAPNNSNPSLSPALEALGELRIANFSQAQLQSEAFVSSWFQTKIRPFLASPSPNFLFCLAIRNFSCQTYQTVIQAFSSQRPSMDSEGQQAVFTHFIKPFLSSNDSSDPGCVSFSNSSEEWLEANLGSFSGFATLQDLLALNPNFSSAESLSVLTPSQLAQLTLSLGASNDTDQIDRVFERLEEGNALENVDEFLTQLAENEKRPDFRPIVRDRVMKRTFSIISPHFPNFTDKDWFVWFHQKLVPVLPSFNAMMLKKATSNISCTNYRVVVSGMSKASSEMPLPRREEIAAVMLDYLRNATAGVIDEPACRRGNESDAEWLEANLGPFSQNTAYSDLKAFNISGMAVVDSLSAKQKAELILDPDSGALEDEAIVREVFASLTESRDDDNDDEDNDDEGNDEEDEDDEDGDDDEQLNQFFQVFATISKQRNVTFIRNPGVRDTILNLTLTALAPEFVDFEPEDFQLWFQVNLAPVMASIRPGSLVVIPRNISCASYASVIAGLRQSLRSLPLHLSANVRSSIEWLKETFKRCSLPDSFMCKQTPVDEKRICALTHSSQLEQPLPIGNSSEGLCNFTINEHACSSATHLTSSNLVTLLKCSVESQRTEPVEVWKLLFRKVSSSLDQALMTFTTMAPNNSNPSLSPALEALGELRIANFSQAQLQSEAFVSSWFQTKIRPFLASPSPNFLFCLAIRNFSCQTYQTVIQAFSSQRPSMDSEGQQAVFTHFIKPFLSSNDSSDPGCVSFSNSSEEWLEANLGSFSGFATLQDLLALNPNFSSAESLSVLTPSQLAQLTLSLGASNDTDQIDRVFERLEEGNALENVDEFLTQLAENEKRPDFRPIVRDRVMKRTFSIISPHFPNFTDKDWFVWFHQKLVPVLPSFNAMMLKKATSNISCTNYRVVVSGMSKASSEMPLPRREEIAAVMLDYLRNATAGVIDEPACRRGNESDAEWLEANLGPFSQNTAYSDLKAFNISGVAVVDSLSAKQKAELILDPDSGALEDEAIVREVFASLTESRDDDNDDEDNDEEDEDDEDGDDDEQLNQFFQAFATISKQRNVTFIRNPGVRDTILNLTLTALAPEFVDFEPEDFQLWFQVNLAPVMASIRPGSLVVIPRNISCASYASVIAGLRQSLRSLPLHLSANVRSSIEWLKETFKRCSLPDSFMCKQTPVDEKRICALTHSSQLEQPLPIGNSSEGLCNFTINEHACSSATHLTSSNLVTLLKCSVESQRTEPVEVWKLLFRKVSSSLDQALMTFTTMAPNNSNPSLSPALEALEELRIANFSQAQLQSEAFVSSWFQTKIRPFLASPSPNFLFCLAIRNFSCQTYQTVIQAFSSQGPSMDNEGQQAVFTHFIKPFLSSNDSSDPGCVSFSNSSEEWLEANLGSFSGFATLQDLLALNPNFSSLDVADRLTLSQLAQLAATPSQLKRTQDVTKIMTVINPVDFGAFFDIVSPAIKIHPENYTEEVKSALLQAVIDRGDLSSPAINDTEFLLWLRIRLSPLLVNLSPSLVTPLFDIGTNRSCNSSQEMITLLDTLHLTLRNNTQREIYQSTLRFLQGPTPLKCYSGGSFYVYLRSTFHSFGFPDLSMFTSLLPPTRESELLSTMSTSELRQFLSQPNVIGKDSDICIIFNNYNNTLAFLETEDVPDDVKRVTLPCVWPLALRSISRSQVDSWFDVRLKNYLRFLSKNLISSSEVQNTSCVAFQKLVSVMGNNFTYNSSEFGQADVYTTIRTYLTAGSEARCYNASDAELNSTAWFVNYIGNFVTFVTLDDLTSFISTSQTEVFLVNQANLELFNNTEIQENVANFYVSQLFEFTPDFNPAKLPGRFLCSSEVPSSAYSSVNEGDTLLILNDLKEFCNGTEDSEVSAALASNIQTLSVETFETLGSASSGLTSSQITSAPPSVLVSSLSILSLVSTWNQEQATTIIQTITASGFQINDGSSLESLGTLIAGVPAESIELIPADGLVNISQSSTFVSNMLAAPTVVQQTFVKKIISVDSSPAKVVKNVPDAMATEIPPALLVFSEETVDISVLNKKTWTSDQASMFFDSLDKTNFDAEKLSPSVLHGFTCTSVHRMSRTRIQRLIRASRPRRGRTKVELKESQLTCMYNLLNGTLSQNFTDYPSDMLLYFNNKDIKTANCRSYFSAMGAADFSVASPVLNKGSLLLSEASTCLGISGVNLSRDNVEVMGNMACTLDSTYIQNADPLILEKLKACKDFSDSQVAAVETLLLSGRTQYGNATTWNRQTLENLGVLPLYFTRNIWGQFKTRTKRRFLKGFMPQMRKRKTKKRKLKALFKQISALKIKRGAGCTVGNITQVTVNDASFPFGYDQTQFDLCLDIPVLKNNLYAISEKVDDDDFQKIILKKLNQAYPSGVSDENVQLLGSVSRVASLNDISKWNVTKIDTLAALMKADDGSWEAAKSKAIITKYLNTSGNSLGSTELNSIDSNLCSLDASTLKTITPDSIRNAKALNVASCSSEQKRVLYEIANSSLSLQNTSITAYYNLIRPYLGGAPLSDVVSLSTQNVSMDVETFQSLDSGVIAAMTVNDVQGLMGSHLQDLKVFENATVVESWRNRQLQVDLDKLNIGLTTNRTSITAPTSSNNNTNVTQGNPNATMTTPMTIQANTTSGGAEFAKHPTSIFLAALLTTVLQILQQPT